MCRPCELQGSSGFAVGADDLGGPRAHTVRPYREKEAHRECSLGEGIPPPLRGPPFDKGGFGVRGKPLNNTSGDGPMRTSAPTCVTVSNSAGG